MHSTSDLALYYPKLELDSLRMLVYADAPFNHNADNTSELGFLIMLTDVSKKYALIHFSSHKSRRVTRSSMAGELLAFSEAFSNAFELKHDLQRIPGKNIPLLTVTDS